MHPILLKIPFVNWPLYSYGFMLGFSLLIGWYLVLYLAKKDGLPPEITGNLYVFTAVSAIIGSRLLFVITNLEKFSNPIDILKINNGGLVAYGGFLGGFFGCYAYCRVKEIPFMLWGDASIVALGTGLMFTRLGCFMFGCDYGMRTESGFGISFPAGSPAWQDQRMMEVHPPGWTETHSAAVHPTQLYESAFGLFLFVMMMTLRLPRFRKFSGQIAASFMVVYGIGRSILETVRDDPERGGIFGLSTSQIIGISTAIPAAIYIVVKLRQAKKDPTGMRLWESARLIPVEGGGGKGSSGGSRSSGSAGGARSAKNRSGRA